MPISVGNRLARCGSRKETLTL
ncbi:hypothetical protein A2U01_0082000, partial [Trifolium medium]|nr:hypothetical protein [Trifolium medium]